MNSIHDMGGMQGMGELGYQQNEPFFHEPWEARMHALILAMGLRESRQRIESIPAPDYLRMSYYERWYTALVGRIIDEGVVTQSEVQTGRMDPASVIVTPSLTPEAARELPFRTSQTEQAVELAPRFKIGDRVRGRNINPTTHTRMPRYTRGRTGVVQRDRGVFVLPDSQTGSLAPKVQHVYLVRFMARDLWGEGSAERDSLNIDMWEDYLEPA